jgi:hypothetical protein
MEQSGDESCAAPARGMNETSGDESRAPARGMNEEVRDYDPAATSLKWSDLGTPVDVTLDMLRNGLPPRSIVYIDYTTMTTPILLPCLRVRMCSYNYPIPGVYIPVGRGSAKRLCILDGNENTVYMYRYYYTIQYNPNYPMWFNQMINNVQVVLTKLKCISLTINPDLIYFMRALDDDRFRQDHVLCDIVHGVPRVRVHNPSSGLYYNDDISCVMCVEDDYTFLLK